MHYHVRERCEICHQPYRQGDRVQRIARTTGSIDGDTVTLPHLVFEREEETVTVAHLSCVLNEQRTARRQWEDEMQKLETIR